MDQNSQTTLPFFIHENPEDVDTEFKQCAGGMLSKNVENTISAFSNTDGGRIVLGVSPDGKAIGLGNKELDKLQLDLMSTCKSVFNIEIIPDIKQVDGKIIAYISASVAQLRPVHIKRKGVHKGSYVRIGSADVLANEDAIKRFSVASKGGAETIIYENEKYEDHLDLQLVSAYIEQLNLSKDNIYQDFSQKEVMLKQKAIDKKDNVTYFGLLAFSKQHSLQEIVSPTINISITHYPGASKVNDIDLTETYLDNREFNGNVLEQFDKAFDYIKTRLPIRGTIEASGKRRDYLIIPEVAIREALANSIAHRDYSTHTARVQIDIYADRMEIINPGISLVPIEQLENAPSATRNPLLMTFLKELGITEQKARGIRTIKLSLKKAGLQEPGFENINDSFKVTLYSSAFMSNTDKTWLHRFARHKLNDRQLNALAHARNKPAGISNSEYRDINSMQNVRDDKKANKDLRKLVDLGLLVPVGEHKKRRYYINEDYI